MTKADQSIGVELLLSRLTVQEVFRGHNEFGEFDSRHTVYVKAEGRYLLLSDKLEVEDGEVDLGEIYFMSVNREEDAEKSHARRGAITIYLMDPVFQSLLRRLRGAPIQEAKLMLTAGPDPDNKKYIRLRILHLILANSVDVIAEKKYRVEKEGDIRRLEVILCVLVGITFAIMIRIFIR